MTAPMIDPKTEGIVTDYTDERMAALLKRAEDAERDLHLCKAQSDYKNRILGVFARMMEVMGEDYDTSDWQRIMSACDTMDQEQITSLLVEYNVADYSMFMREFIVTLTVPVTVSVRVEAMDEEDAESKAKDELDYNSLFDYDPEYDIHYNADIYNVEEA